MDVFSFKIAAYGLIVGFCLCWGVTDCTRSTPRPSTFKPAKTESVTTITTTEPTTTKRPPDNVQNVEVVSQTETSVIIGFQKVTDSTGYTLSFCPNECKVEIISSMTNPVQYLVSPLTAARTYNMTLYTMDNVTPSTGFHFNATTAPENVAEFKKMNQTENSITLQWTKKSGIALYTLKYGDVQKNFTAEELSEPAQYEVPGLNKSTQFDFQLFTVFDGVRSTGANLTAFTAPSKAEDFRAKTQNETSITLKWSHENKDINYIFMVNGREQNLTGQQLSNPAEHTVSDLKNATRYSFTLVTVFANIRGAGVDLSAVTAPRNALWFKPIEQDETSITLQWEEVPGITNYTLQSTSINKTITGSQETVQHLTSGTLYHFILYSVFENVLSSGTPLTAATTPRNSQMFKSTGQDETSITLQWELVPNVVDYILQSDKGNKTITGSQETVQHLTSGTLHSFILFSVFENLPSTGTHLTAATVPPKVSSVNVTERTTTKITLQWESARENWTYLFELNNKTIKEETGGSHIMSHSFEDLKPGTVYGFKITTVFETLKSVPYVNHTVTGINCAIVDWKVTESTIQGKVEGVFTNAKATNGSKEVVSSGPDQVSLIDLYPGATYNMTLMYEEWVQCSHILITIPPMLTAHCKNYAAGYSIYIEWDSPIGCWNYVEVNVSGQTHKVGENGKQFAELPNFQPAKKYQVNVSSRSGPQRSKPYYFTCATDDRGVIAGAFFGVLLFLILACAVGFIILKRPDIITQKMSLIGGSRTSVRKCKAIPVAKFPSHFNELSADENRGFSQEYEDLSLVGTDQTQKAAIILENKPKNRFVNVLPYDRCRVKLSSSNDHDDYINANYMPGYHGDKEFIATQGPMPSTVNDFWRMVWEQNARGIVMVTNCTEGGRTKCEQYWPADTKPCVCGYLTVSTTSEEKEFDWTLREFKIKHNKTSEERTVKHFHFTAWPDHGVPQGTEVLIRFRALVRQHIQTETAGTPTVVHCSAGVGRTGTIIALDVVLQQLEKEKIVDINGFVHRMRQNRPHMVQTESQYVFLHQCIMDSLQPSEKCDENIYENQDMIYANATALREFHKNNV